MTEELLQNGGKHYITWEKFHKDTVALAQKLPPLSWKGMIAITRGGLMPAGILARLLNISLIETVCLSSYNDVTDQQTDLTILKNLSLQNGKNWLVIDDLIDTGATVTHVRKMLPDAHFAALYGKQHGKHLIDTFVREINAWIVFPWEMSPEDLHHGRALNAFTNPTTNSYKRLVPGYEAPVLLGYSARNRSAACRIPHVTSPKGRRIETRFPDPAANPYLALSALLMAGLDGIKKKIHPKEALDVNLYELDPQRLETIPRLCASLKEALQALDQDRGFLLEGNVFSNDQIDAYIALKANEAHQVDHTPHPLEFKLYYGC